MKIQHPKVYKHKNGIVEIVYYDRVEMYKKIEGQTITKKSLEDEGCTVEYDNMQLNFDDEYYKNNGFKKVNYKVKK